MTKPPTVPFVPPTEPSFVDRPFGVPPDDYDPNEDLAGSIALGLATIRERMARGGPGWKPTASQ